MTDERFRLLRQESEHHIRLGSTHQQKRKGGIIHDTTPPDAAVRKKEGAKVRRSRHGHVHVHVHDERKDNTRRDLTLQHAQREKAVQLLQQQQLLISMRHVISMRLAKSRCTGKWRK